MATDIAALKASLVQEILAMMRSGGGDGAAAPDDLDADVEQYVASVVDEVLEGYDGDLTGVTADQMVSIIGKALENAASTLPE